MLVYSLLTVISEIFFFVANNFFVHPITPFPYRSIWSDFQWELSRSEQNFSNLFLFFYEYLLGADLWMTPLFNLSPNPSNYTTFWSHSFIYFFYFSWFSFNLSFKIFFCQILFGSILCFKLYFSHPFHSLPFNRVIELIFCWIFCSKKKVLFENYIKINDLNERTRICFSEFFHNLFLWDKDLCLLRLIYISQYIHKL